MLFQIGVDSEQSVLTIRQNAVNALAQGGVTVSYNVEGMSASKSLMGMNLREVIQECNKFLNLINPTLYPIMTERRIRFTIPRYF